jgi:hypothetical protein
MLLSIPNPLGLVVLGSIHTNAITRRRRRNNQLIKPEPVTTTII